MVENFSHKSSIVSLLSVNQYTFPIYIRKCTCFSPTIGGDGSRQYGSDALVFVRVFCKTVLFYTRRKICNGKNKGLGTFSNLLKEITCFSPTIGGDGIRQVASGAAMFTRGLPLVSKFMYCFKRSKNFSLEKQMVFLLFPILVFIFLLKAF